MSLNKRYLVVFLILSSILVVQIGESIKKPSSVPVNFVTREIEEKSDGLTENKIERDFVVSESVDVDILETDTSQGLETIEDLKIDFILPEEVVISSFFEKSDTEGELAQVVSVVDGDTTKVLLNGVEETIRFIGIDTPETVHPSKPVDRSFPYGKNTLE
jgi:hypothetical protein